MIMESSCYVSGLRGRIVLAFLCGAAMRGMAAPYETGIAPASSHVWSEQAGWVNMKATHGEATIWRDGSRGYLTGYAWAENIGWIKLGSTNGGPYANLSATNWGVNMDADWMLSGYAWSETCGWINFQPDHSQARVDPLTGQFSGYVWSENAGWIHTGASGLTYRLSAILPQATHGVPHWWLWQYGWTNDFDSASLADDDHDGMDTWGEYVAGTDPTQPLSYLGIRHPDGHEIEWFSTTVTVTWYSVEGKIYDLYKGPDLRVGFPNELLASNIVGQAGETSWIDAELPALRSRFYRVHVRR